jgi:hypothetical protein
MVPPASMRTGGRRAVRARPVTCPVGSFQREFSALRTFNVLRKTQSETARGLACLSHLAGRGEAQPLRRATIIERWRQSSPSSVNVNLRLLDSPAPHTGRPAGLAVRAIERELIARGPTSARERDQSAQSREGQNHIVPPHKNEDGEQRFALSERRRPPSNSAPAPLFFSASPLTPCRAGHSTHTATHPRPRAWAPGPAELTLEPHALSN